MHDEWFVDEEGVRQSVGLLERPVVRVSNAREVSSIDLYICLFFWNLFVF